VDLVTRPARCGLGSRSRDVGLQLVRSLVIDSYDRKERFVMDLGVCTFTPLLKVRELSVWLQQVAGPLHYRSVTPMSSRCDFPFRMGG
jgi:hypothetical protein